MLAKEIKIANIKQQRLFIEEQLKKFLGDDRPRDGDVSYPYVGYVFPENIVYFEKEGFDVIEIEYDDARLKGNIITLFTPSDEIELSEEEIAQAEAVNYKQEEADAFNPLAAIFGGMS